MDAPPDDSTTLSICSPDFVAAVRRQAESDAEAVGEFIRSLPHGPKPDAVEPVQIAPEILLGLALAIRLRRWELNHIRVHIDAGVSSSSEVFGRIATLKRGRELEEFVSRESVNALRVFHDSFLWSASDCDLRVDIAIVAQEDDQFLDAIVDFLFQQCLERTREDSSK